VPTNAHYLAFDSKKTLSAYADSSKFGRQRVMVHASHELLAWDEHGDWIMNHLGWHKTQHN